MKPMNDKKRHRFKKILRYYLVPFIDILNTEKLVSRKDFFLYLPGIIFNVLIYYLIILYLQPFQGEFIKSINSSLYSVLRVLTYSIAFAPFYTLSLRRLNDAGKSFLWWYAIFLPRSGVFGLIKISIGLYIWYLLCQPSVNRERKTSLENFETELEDKLSPSSVQELYSIGRQLESQGNLDQAINYYTNALSIEPENIQILNSRGYARSLIEDYQGAINDFNIALNIVPTDHIVLMNRGSTYCDLNNYNEALKDYNKIIEILPDYKDAYINRSIVKRTLEDYQGAIFDLNKILESDPNDEEIYYDLAKNKQSLGDHQGAIIDYSFVIDNHDNGDDISPSYFGRGFSKYCLDDYQSAIADLEKGLELNPDCDAFPYYLLGTSKLKIGDLQGSFDAIFKAAEMGDEKALKVLEDYSQSSEIKGTAHEVEVNKMIDSLRNK